jgi:hypothetical protein
MMASTYQLLLLDRLKGVGRLISHRYYVRVWNHVPHDPDDPIWRLELRLERVSEQISVNVLRNIPNPAQFDDWKMYQEYLKQAMIQAMKAPSTNMVTYLVRPSDIVARAAHIARSQDVADREWKFEDIFE